MVKNLRTSGIIRESVFFIIVNSSLSRSMSGTSLKVYINTFVVIFYSLIYLVFTYINYSLIY